MSHQTKGSQASASSSPKPTFSLKKFIDEAIVIVLLCFFYPGLEVLGIWLFSNIVVACIGLVISLVFLALALSAICPDLKPGDGGCLFRVIALIVLGWGGLPFLTLALSNLSVVWIVRIPAILVVALVTTLFSIEVVGYLLKK